MQALPTTPHMVPHRTPSLRLARASALATLLFALLACSGEGDEGAEGEEGDEPDSPADVQVGDVSAAGVGLGSGTVSGAVGSRPFDAVGAAYRIGAPDDAAHTLVFYVFDAPITCAELASAGWDATVADGSQSIELKLIGTATGTYAVSPDATPGSGEAGVNYTVTSRTGTPVETALTGGSVTLSTLSEAGSTGTFDLTFATGDHLVGSFDAPFCPPGREP